MEIVINVEMVITWIGSLALYLMFMGAGILIIKTGEEVTHTRSTVPISVVGALIISLATCMFLVMNGWIV